jgi:prepilin-type N-terminal cleavage/methylation domain-containing protein
MIMRHIQIARIGNSRGFTLIEVVITIIIIGIIMAVATRYMSTSLDTANVEQTKTEMDQIVFAIVGNPEAATAGARPDFGYVGDIGALPPNLDALVENPGGYSTWAGPYIARGFNVNDFKLDAWQSPYTLTDTVLISSGSGSTISRTITSNLSLLFNNSIEGLVVDANHSRPGMTYKDSLAITLTYPNGSGGLTVTNATPSAAGNFTFSGVPVGNHNLSVIYQPDSDTVNYQICVSPGSEVKMTVQFPADLWL